MIRVRCAAAVLMLAACSGRSIQPASAPGERAVLAPPRPLMSGAVWASAGAGSGSGAGATPGSAAPAAAPVTPAAPAAPGTLKVTLADVGLEAASLDRTGDPCVDFYQFACGGWIQGHPIPADRATWSRGSELAERTAGNLMTLLEGAAKATTSNPATRKLGAFYAACMDEAAVDRAGTAPFAALLARTRAVKDARTWLAAVVELHKLGIFVVWNNRVAPDLKDSATNVTYLDAAGLGLPDRDYYINPELRGKLDGYRAQVARVLGLVPGARFDPGDVVAIETEIANLTRTATEKRDVLGGYHPTDVKALGRQVKSVDWTAYWKGLGAAPSKKIIVGTPRMFAALDRLRARFKPAQWAGYFTYHLVQHMAFAMPRPLAEAAFELDRLVAGVEKQRERSKRCVDHTSDALGELLGASYVASYFPGSSKQAATGLVDALVKAMVDDIAGLDWMAESTRQTALAKLARMLRMIGYPERPRSYDFEVKPTDFAGNALRAAAFDTHRQLARAGKPVDRAEWEMPAFEVDAYYEPSVNHSALPAGILQPPFFGADRGVAVNLGGIGMVIGHELTHAFDDEGAQFDGDGNLRNWWQKEDLARFAERGKCVADEYSTFEAMPRKFVQGALTLGEDIADLGGVKLAFRAYRALRRDVARPYVADGFSEDQQFFLAVGQAWCARERPEETERRLTADPHAPPKFRVFGALRNLPEFAGAFHCVPGTPMRPARTCTVW